MPSKIQIILHKLLVNNFHYLYSNIIYQIPYFGPKELQTIFSSYAYYFLTQLMKFELFKFKHPVIHKLSHLKAVYIYIIQL